MKFTNQKDQEEIIKNLETFCKIGWFTYDEDKNILYVANEEKDIVDYQE